MGGIPYEYVVDFEKDVEHALEALRARVFAAGEYCGAECRPSSPEEAFRMADASGTESILDIVRISDEPVERAACALTDDELEYYFGTTKPTLGMARKCDELWEDIDRGTARYVVCYEGDIPTKIVFLGYSFD